MNFVTIGNTGILSYPFFMENLFTTIFIIIMSGNIVYILLKLILKKRAPCSLADKLEKLPERYALVNKQINSIL